MRIMSKKQNCVWQDRKRTFFGLPWSFTRYYLSSEKLIVSTGFFNIREEEIRLYRILDLTLNRRLSERIFGLGTIHFCTADKSTPEFDVKRIKNSEKIRDRISQLVEEERQNHRIAGREFMSADDMDFDDMH